MKTIQFSKPTIKLEKEDYNKIKGIINSGWVCIGKYVQELEAEFKRRFKVKYAIATSNCTQGLIISLKAAGWRNKRIAVPAFTWPSTIFAIESNVGNTPVFCDIDPKTWLIDPNSLDKNSYDAVIAVDTFGNEAFVKTDKPVIYDAAHGFDVKDLGHRGLAEVISFSFTKVVSASEGGMILTNDKAFAETASELRRLSSRMEEINAVIALRSIKNYKTNQQKKLDIIGFYKENLLFDFNLQEIPICTNNSVFSILLPSTHIRNAIVSALNKNNIEYKVYYEPLVEGLPNTDRIYSRILALPTYADIRPVQNKICKVINSTVKDISHGSFVRFTPGKKYLKDSGYLKTFLRREN
jgi:3-dehydro-glucose-6-phosphate--glutamate transaminase